MAQPLHQVIGFVFHRWFDRYFDRPLQFSGDWGWGMWRNGSRCKEMGELRHIAHCSTRAVDIGRNSPHCIAANGESDGETIGE